MRGRAVSIRLAVLQMSVANGLSFSDFSLVLIEAGCVAKCWCRRIGSFQPRAVADLLVHFDGKSLDI